MAVIETWRRRDLSSLTEIEYLQGNLFSQDAAGNLIGVELYQDGAAYAGGGSVSANVIRADGATVAVTGSISGNRASVTLPAACYAVVGPIIIVVKLTVGSAVTTIGAFASSVYASTTSATVDPGTLVTSVQTLISDLEDAVESFADYSGLLAMLAPTYSSSGTYAVGDFVIYNNGLYRCISAISSGESWTAAHWAVVKIGNELKDLTNDIAPEYDGTIAFSAGSYCRHLGNFYRALQDIPAGESWTAGHWSVCYLANDLWFKGKETDDEIKRALSAEDAVVNDALSYINYGYDTPHVHEEDPESEYPQWRIGVVRNGQVVVLNKTTYVSGSDIRVKISGDVGYATNNNQMDAFTGGVAMKAGHEYVVTEKLLSGSSSEDGSSTISVPNIGIYKTGTHSNAGTIVRAEDGRSLTNTIKPNADGTYNICIHVPKTKYLFDDAKLLITLMDRTEGSRVVDVENDVIYHDQLISAEHGCVDYGYSLKESVLPEISTSPNTSQCIGVKRLGMHITLTGGGNNYTAYLKVNGTIDRSTNTSTVAGWSDSLSLTEGKQYKAALKPIGGTSNVDPYVDVYNTGSTTNLGIMGDNNLERIFTAGSTAVNIILRVPKESSFSNREYILTLKEYTEDSDDLAEYYFENDYLPDRVQTILEHDEEMGMSGDSFIWFTDPHFYHQYPADSPDGPVYTENGMQSVPLIRYIRNRTNIRKVFCGGDIINGAKVTKELAMKLMSDARNAMAPIWDNLYMAVGNHEWNNPSNDDEWTDEMLGMGFIYNLFLKDKETQYGAVSERGDFWTDNPTQKIRYFFIGANYKANISGAQIHWFGAQLANTPEGYTVVVVSHLGIESDNEFETTFVHITKLMDAADAGGSYTYGNVEYDYSNLVNVTVACAITGHTHYDQDKTTTGGIPVIATTCDRGPTRTSDTAEKNARAYNTINEQAIDVVQIDTEAKKIYLTRIGGSFDGTAALQDPDREFSY